MQDPKDSNSELVKPDLKHDSMEYNAATDGDDPLDIDSESALDIEDEFISAEELEYLEDDDVDDKADALNTAETDSLADEDNFINEPGDQEELPDEPDPENDADEDLPA